MQDTVPGLPTVWFFVRKKHNKQKLTKGAAQNPPITHQGFTGHEEIESMNLIHMGGRIYDPVLGRFLTADPTAQEPDNGQELNPYSYCINNPLHYTDPTGFGIFDFIGDIIQAIGEVVCAVVNFVIDVAKYIAHSQILSALVQLAVGLTPLAPILLPLVSAAMTALNGGDFADIMKAAALSFLSIEDWGAIGGELAEEGADWSMRALAHGVFGGCLNTLQGGSFKDGFLACAVAEAVEAPISKIGVHAEGFVAEQAAILERCACSGIVGGTVAALTGGNFWDGAKTAAFARLFNDEAHALEMAQASNDPRSRKLAAGVINEELTASPKDQMIKLGMELPGAVGVLCSIFEAPAIIADAIGIAVGEGISNLQYSEHAAARMNERGVSEADVVDTMQNEPFQYHHGGEWKTGYYDYTSKIFIGQSSSGKIITVINDVNENYINNLKELRP